MSQKGKQQTNKTINNKEMNATTGGSGKKAVMTITPHQKIILPRYGHIGQQFQYLGQ